ncbi:hypothetical protein Q7P37_010762 [Cladosporium fusiforme]
MANEQPQQEEQQSLEGLQKLTSKIVNDFSTHVDNAELGKAWQSLLTLKHEILSNQGEPISRRTFLAKKLHQYMRRVIVHYTKYLATDAVGTSVPTPRAFVLLLRDLDLHSPAMRSELLWRLSNGLAMRFHMDEDVDHAVQSVALNELVSVWYESMEAKVGRSIVSRTDLTDKSRQEWSILPAASSVTGEGNGLQTPLHEVLALLLPTDTAEGGVEAVADYQSALFVTIDLLKVHMSAPKDAAPSSAIVSRWQPFVTFWGEVLGRIMTPSVPPTIRSRLEQSQDPVLSYYESLVRRCNLAEIPAVRQNRNEAQKDVPRIKLNELGQPLDKPPVAAKVRKGNKSAPRMKPQTSEQEPLPPAATDKASLVEAGFSVNEDFDMDPEVHRQIFGWVKRLGRAVEGDNLLIAEACWKDVSTFSSSNAGESSVPLFLYEHLMLAFLTLRQPKTAIEVWNAVLKAGLSPTVKTWTVMMRGCSRARDPDTMEMFWARMRAQDVQPDQHAWSVRIYCLLKAGRLSKGFPALRDMGQEWIDAVKRKQRASLQASMGRQQKITKLPNIDLTQWTADVDDVPRPNLVIVNTAVAALAGKEDQQIPRVLSWAREFAIELDLTTYNALLNVSMRHSRTAEAFSILKLMQNRAIEPNSTTITVILTALFESDYFAHLGTEEQTTKLLGLITAIESSSPTAKLDHKGYALTIDRMLKQHDNPAAARALLEHMSARGLEPTSYIYTILMTSYFSANPPDFAAAEALWSRLQESNSGYGAALDTIFYDRMVEAYAQHHAHVGTAPMMRFLGRMSREGKRPGWRMLEHVARALAERNEWGLLGGLVSDIRESKGLVRVGVRGLVGQNEFWRFVIGTGILDSEGITNEQELRKNVGGSSFRSEQ